MDLLFNSTLLYDNYNISIFAQLFHSIPHFDIRLHYLKNTTFNPNDNEYLESLGILVAIPGFWLIITLLFFLIFFLCRCCDANNKKKRKLTFCKLCLFLFAITSCLIIGLGILGSIISHNGMIKVQNSTQDMSQVLQTIKNDTLLISDSLQNQIDKDVDDLKLLLDGPLVTNVSVRTALAQLFFFTKRNLTRSIKKVDEIYAKVERINFNSVPMTIKKIEQIRWPTTFGVLGSLAFVCLILIWGILRHSRCVLILFSVLGLLSLVVCWVITSVYLGITVAGSDFCLDPQPFISEQLNTIIDANIFNYYVECDKSTQNPFRKQLREGQTALEFIGKLITEVDQICKKACDFRDVKDYINNINTNLNPTEKLFKSIQALLDCERIHNDYINSMTASCKDVLEGVVLMLISSSAAGVCFTILVLCASHTWINIRKKRPTIAETDETDPFLPPASSTSTTSSANSKRIRDSYGSGSSGRPR